MLAVGLELCILFMSGLSFLFPRLYAYAKMIRKAVLKTLSETQVSYNTRSLCQTAIAIHLT